MQQVTNQQKIKPWMGFVLFAVLMVYFIFVCVPMQTAWGIWGLIATEVSFLVIAIVYGLIFKIPLKEMFPIKKFSAREFFGSIMLVAGGSMFGLISVGIVGVLFPSTLESGDVAAITDYISNGPGYIFLIFIIAVLPAICEEAIHRGAILTSFRSIKKEWVIVLIMAVFFGINHLSFLRFINTAILGACLSYIVIKKNNILLSSISHFTVNFAASSISYISSLLFKKATGSALSGSDISSGSNETAWRSPASGASMSSCTSRTRMSSRPMRRARRRSWQRRRKRPRFGRPIRRSSPGPTASPTGKRRRSPRARLLKSCSRSRRS